MIEVFCVWKKRLEGIGEWYFCMLLRIWSWRYQQEIDGFEVNGVWYSSITVLGMDCLLCGILISGGLSRLWGA